MRNHLIFILLASILLWSCKTPEARRPVKVSSGSHISESVERNKAWIEQEEKDIQSVIENDSTHDYVNSELGFWYYYEDQKPNETEMAEFGDVVEFQQEIKDLDGNIIYSKEELGVQTYHMDKEELITGLREGLKIMKEGETVTFIFPSYKAYGYYGDYDKIGTNMTIQSTVTILNIEQIN